VADTYTYKLCCNFEYLLCGGKLQVAQTISSELVNKVFVLSVGEVCKYGDMYRKAIVDYKTAYFKDRSKVGYLSSTVQRDRVSRSSSLNRFVPGLHVHQVYDSHREQLRTLYRARAGAERKVVEAWSSRQ
jgi:hypothetical protein